MEAVTTGLIGGSVLSLLIIVGGAVSIWTDVWQRWSNPYITFVWLTTLSALTVGQLYLTYHVSLTLLVTPSQTEKAVVT